MLNEQARFINILAGCSPKVIFADICITSTQHNQIEIGVARKFDTNVLCKSSGLEFRNIIQRPMLERSLAGISLFRCKCLLHQ
jgi:hypothetical protein